MAMPSTDISVSALISEMQIGTTYGSGVGEYPLSYIDTYMARDGWADVNQFTQTNSNYSLGQISGLCGRKNYSLDCSGCSNVDTDNWQMTVNFNQFTTYPATNGPNYDANQLTSSVVSNGGTWNENYYDGNIDMVQLNWSFTGRPPGNNVTISDNLGGWPGSPYVGSASSASSGGGLAIDNCVNYAVVVTT